MNWFAEKKYLIPIMDKNFDDVTFENIESKIKKFSDMYSYNYTYLPDNLCFCLKPKSVIFQARNSFRPEMNVFVDRDLKNEPVIRLLLSLPHPTKVIIASLYILLLIFGGVLSFFSYMGFIDLRGIGVWIILCFFTTVFFIIGRIITFRHLFLVLQRIIERPKTREIPD